MNIYKGGLYISRCGTVLTCQGVRESAIGDYSVAMLITTDRRKTCRERRCNENRLWNYYCGGEHHGKWMDEEDDPLFHLHLLREIKE